MEWTFPFYFLTSSRSLITVHLSNGELYLCRRWAIILNWAYLQQEVKEHWVIVSRDSRESAKVLLDQRARACYQRWGVLRWDLCAMAGGVIKNRQRLAFRDNYSQWWMSEYYGKWDKDSGVAKKEVVRHQWRIIESDFQGIWGAKSEGNEINCVVSGEDLLMMGG